MGSPRHRFEAIHQLGRVCQPSELGHATPLTVDVDVRVKDEQRFGVFDVLRTAGDRLKDDQVVVGHTHRRAGAAS
jgi:hypothetical protein